MKKFFSLELILINTLLMIPFIFVLLCLLLTIGINAVGLGGIMNLDKFGSFVGIPVLLAYYYFPSWGLYLMPFCTAFNIFSLFKTDLAKGRILLVFYLLILLIYDAYLIWWYWSGQIFDRI